MTTKTVEQAQEQVTRLDARLGVGVGAVRERARLAAALVELDPEVQA